jgi:hypothetical protein
MSKVNDISEEELKKATGRGWEEWINLLDDVGLQNMTHKEVAQMIFEKGYCENTWWCQQIAAGVKQRNPDEE